jgi:hypothetical protein
MNILKQKGFQGIVIILLLILGAVFYDKWKTDSTLEKESKFTIGEIVKIQFFDNGEPLASLIFDFKLKKNTAGAYLGSDLKKNHKIGDKLFIQFSPKDPSVFKVLDNPRVPKNLIPPIDGWDSIPI